MQHSNLSTGNENESTTPIAAIRARPLQRIALALLLILAALAFLSPSRAEAANITRLSSFACGYHSLTVYPPQLYTSGGNETVYYSLRLWKYTTSGWVAGATWSPWYSATVGPNGIYIINAGLMWWLGQSGYRNINYPNMTPGYYMVQGDLYGSTPHWATVANTNNDAYCHVS